MIAIGNIIAIFTNGNEATIYTNDGFRKRSYFVIYHERPRTVSEFCNIENTKYYEICEYPDSETFKDCIKQEFQLRNFHQGIQKIKEVEREKGLVKSF